MCVTEQLGVPTSIGTPKEVRASLSRSHADRALIVSFDRIKLGVFEVLAEAFVHVASSMYEVLQALERLAEVFVTRKPPSPHLLKESAILVQARNAVLESCDWLAAADIVPVAQLSTCNPSAQPSKWKKSRGRSLPSITQGSTIFLVTARYLHSCPQACVLGFGGQQHEPQTLFCWLIGSELLSGSIK